MNNDKVMFEDWEYEYMNEMIKIDTINNIKNDFQEEFDKKEKKYKAELSNNEKRYKAELSNNEKRYKENERKSILNMIKEGLDQNVISRITGKSIKEIEKIIM